MKIKDILTHLLNLEESIKYETMRYETMLDIQAVKITNEPKLENNHTPAIQRTLEKRHKLKNRIDKMINEREGIEDYIENLCDRIPQKQRIIIELRYIDGMEWRDVGDTLFLNESDYLDNYKKYHHRMMVLQSNAIKSLEKVRATA